MKKHESAFWFVAVICAALIFIGCAQDPETETVTNTKYVAADIDGLNTLMDEGATPIRYVGGLEIGAETVVIPDGITVNVDDGVTLSTGTFIVAGNLTLGTGEKIVVDGAGTVVGSDEVVAKVDGESAVTGPVAATVADAFTETGTNTVALVLTASAADLTSANVPADKTLYVANTLTLAAAPSPGGKIIPVGKSVSPGP